MTSSTETTMRIVTAAIILLLVSLLIALAIYGLSQSPQAVFAVSARTGVLEVRPLCGEKLVWDLPGAFVHPRSQSFPDPVPEQCSGWDEQCYVTVTMFGGAIARLELRGAQTFGITFGRDDTVACPDVGADSVTISTADTEFHGDELGYYYKSDRPFGVTAPEIQRFSIPISGRLVIGQDLQFGAGWQTAPTLLRSGTIYARDQAVWTGERITVMSEDIDAGSVIDTRPASRYLDGPLASPGLDPESARGFVRFFDDHLDVQFYRNRSIAVHSYLGVDQRLEVPRWKIWWNSPGPQTVASIVAFALGILGLVFTYFQAKRAMSESKLIRWVCRSSATSVQDEPPPIAETTTVDPSSRGQAT